MILEVAIITLVIADVLTGTYDAELTEEGLKKGVAVESNPIIKAIAGSDKPVYFPVILYNSVKTVLFGTLAALAAVSGNPAFIGLTLGALASDSLLHVMGGKQWKTLIDGGTIPTSQTAWQKFIGWW